MNTIAYIRDFIILYYHLNECDDSWFWRACRDMDIPETLSRRMILFRETGKVFRE